MVDVIDEDAAEDDVNLVGPVGDAHSVIIRDAPLLVDPPDVLVPLEDVEFSRHPIVAGDPVVALSRCSFYDHLSSGPLTEPSREPGDRSRRTGVSSAGRTSPSESSPSREARNPEPAESPGQSKSHSRISIEMDFVSALPSRPASRWPQSLPPIRDRMSTLCFICRRLRGNLESTVVSWMQRWSTSLL